MGSYCHVCDQFVENLDVCSEGEYHRDDYERYPMRDFSKWYRYEPPEEDFPEQTLEEKLSSDVFWYQTKVRTRSKSEEHRKKVVSEEVRKLLNNIEYIYDKTEKVRLFEKILIIFKENKYILKNNKLAEVTISKIDTFSDYSSEFRHLKSFKFQLFGKC